MSGRRRLAVAGIVAAGLVAGAVVAVAYGLSTGFERAARGADLPDVTARFAPQRIDDLDERVRALPNLQARSYRYEIDDIPLRGPGGATDEGRLELLLGGRRGYDIVEGRDLGEREGEVVVERGVAEALEVGPGDTLEVGPAGPLPVVGVAVSPDNVAFPLAKTAKIYVEPFDEAVDANVALLWVNDRERTDITLASARTVAFGLGDLRFLTREGVAVTIDQAAGVVIALLVAFALVALIAAGTMLAAGAHADVQRSLPALGVRRALGFTPGGVVAQHAWAALRIAAPAGAAGVAVGALAVSGPARSLLETLNQSSPGWALAVPLLATWLVVCLVVVAAAALPAWRAARKPIAPLLRGGELAARPPRARGGGGLAGMGARFAVSARGRWAGSVATIGACAGVVLLMLGLASLVVRLRDDPAVLGKRYQLTVNSDASLLGNLRAIPGVADATQRYEIEAADAFRLGEPVRLIAYGGDHTRFEAPALAAGRRIRADGEAEIGQGLADALGLAVGATLATLDPSGRELRLKVVGIVRALDRSGRVAWIPEETLRGADAGGVGQSVIRLESSEDRASVEDELRALGLPPIRTEGATTRNAAFLATLAGVLRAVALLVGLVCLYALVQGLAMTARERRGTLAVLRACGGARADVAAVLTGAALAVAVPAAIVAVGLERFVLAPAVTALAAGYAALPLEPTGLQVAALVAGLLVLAVLAAVLVARSLSREPIVLGLREELP